MKPAFDEPTERRALVCMSFIHGSGSALRGSILDTATANGTISETNERTDQMRRAAGRMRDTTLRGPVKDFGKALRGTQWPGSAVRPRTSQCIPASSQHARWNR